MKPSLSSAQVENAILEKLHWLVYVVDGELGLRSTYGSFENTMMNGKSTTLFVDRFNLSYIDKLARKRTLETIFFSLEVAHQRTFLALLATNYTTPAITSVFGDARNLALYLFGWDEVRLEKLCQHHQQGQTVPRIKQLVQEMDTAKLDAMRAWIQAAKAHKAKNTKPRGKP